MSAVRGFDELIAEGASAPITGWDFSWLEGRATEERPSWRHFDRVGARVATATRLLDVQTGVGNMIADLPALPPVTVATDGYRPSIAAAAPRLRARGAHLVLTQEDRPAIPFADDSFDLITSRHPVDTWWYEIARVLAPGGSYLSQQVGPRSLLELSEVLMGPLPTGSRRDPARARRSAEDAGLVVDELVVERPATVFHDIGAVVYFLRLVVWIVPDFSVERYRDRLRVLHDRIVGEGPFVATASRFLIDARKPQPAAR